MAPSGAAPDASHQAGEVNGLVSLTPPLDLGRRADLRKADDHPHPVGKVRQHAADPSRTNLAVGIRGENHLPSRFGDPQAERGLLGTRPFGSQQSHSHSLPTELAHDVASAIGGAVVNDDDFVAILGIILRQQGAQTAGYVRGFVAGGDDDRGQGDALGIGIAGTAAHPGDEPTSPEQVG